MDKRKKKKATKKSKGQIVELSEYRKNKSEARRREYERILFNRILGVYSFAEREGLNHIEIMDMSYSGLRFNEDKPSGKLNIGDKLALRFYFTPSSYLRLVLKVKRIKPYKEEGRDGLEYGCEFDKSTKGYEVVRQLVAFMHSYSEVSCRDASPPMIFF